MKDHYLEVTGHVYVNPFTEDQPGRSVKPKGWQASLKKTLQWARANASDPNEYLQLLKTKQVTVTIRNKKGNWSYHTVVNGKKKTVRDFYQRRDKTTGLIKTTRGMGEEFTPFELVKYFKKKQNKETRNDRNEKESKQVSRRAKRTIEANKQRQRLDVNVARQQGEQQRRPSEETGNQAKSSGLGTGYFPSHQQEESGIQPGD